jgi:hypothetical protein
MTLTLRRLALVPVALVMLACGRQEAASDQATATDTAPAVTTEGATSTATNPASPGGTALVPSTSVGTTVLVLLEDNSIGAPTTPIPPGPAVFTITNGGSQLHNLFIEGPGLSKAAGEPIDKNGSTTLNAELQEGTYTLYCPILDHRDKGETATLTVRR